jgi:hypothetical protein
MTESYRLASLRIGMLMIISGILVGLVFSTWNPLFLAGFIFFFPEFIWKLNMQNRDDKNSS